jgi:hypothetical protein
MFYPRHTFTTGAPEYPAAVRDIFHQGQFIAEWATVRIGEDAPVRRDVFHVATRSAEATSPEVGYAALRDARKRPDR